MRRATIVSASCERRSSGTALEVMASTRIDWSLELLFQ
jgi:hypothetical protein